MSSEAATPGKSAPAISVIVVGRDGFPTLTPILACLAEQTIAAQIEVIATLPELNEGAALPQHVTDAFHSFKSVAVGPIGNRGTAAAHGVRIAHGAVVAFTENHCFPDSDWAEKLLDSYKEDYAGVGPAIVNANPESTLAWTSYAGGYVAFAAHQSGGAVEELPIHNTSYRLQLLAPLSNELEDLLADERRLMRRLREGGGKFLFRPDVKARHINEATWTLVLGLSYFNGRRYGGRRGLQWSWPRRVAYALAFPLLSAPLLWATTRNIALAQGRPPFFPKFLPVLWLQSLAHSLGEAVGYIAGPKDVFDFVDDEEFMILERLGGKFPKDERIARFVAMASPVPERKVRL